ncbi:family 16 glycosylhydrolase [Photobacterium sp. DA100]|uniref:family 16 glycosylhydrolase n=1 Tax=Photobacterium sp. DA100 TaxID=3027472 RepID=UPI00247AEC61|nr:family 16 glycosylhydrolase [Photobacterium sp. DA100]WEM43416.1 family 16 glycosylhydrolase [Photobacterium sp. DA100]
MRNNSILTPSLLLVSSISLAAPPEGKGNHTEIISAPSFSDTLTSFDAGHWQAADGWANGSPFLNAWSSTALDFSTDGMAIVLSDDPLLGYYYTSGELRTTDFYGYGCYEVEMRPAAVSGVVSAFFTFMGPYDNVQGGNGHHNEIDIEFLGNDTSVVQLNFWTNDDQYANGHEQIIELGFDASKSFNQYAFDWSESGINWYINKKLVYSVISTSNDPTPKVSDGTQKIMMNMWPVDATASGWAGEFTYPVMPILGQFKNVRFTEGSYCTFDYPEPSLPSPSNSLAISSHNISLNIKATQASATVTVTDSSGQTIEGVSVTGKWSGVVSDGDEEKITEQTGSALFYSRRSRSASGTYQFCVTSLSKAGYSWSASNVDLTCSEVDIP